MAGAEVYKLEDVKVAGIFLWEDNPRHKSLKGENAVIARLCGEEEILALATDIVRNGLNPLERVALVPIGGKGDAGTFTVAEGNRRVCALKLLMDPDKAPTNLKPRFAKLAASWNPVEQIAAAVFQSHDAVRLWLERLHGGAQGGLSRKKWDADQTQRFSGSAKNLTALRLLDYAEKRGFVSEAERKRRLTTAQRFLNSEKLMNVLGMRLDGDQIVRDRPKEDFDGLVQEFLRDLVKGEVVTSRMNMGDIGKYAEQLSTRVAHSDRRIDAQAVDKADQPTAPPKPPKPTKPPAPATPKTIHLDAATAQALNVAKHQKLVSLYHSITTIDAAKHAPLVTVGAWALLEILTRCAGSTSALDAFLSKERLKELTGKPDVRAETQALKRLVDNGNTTKHHPVAAAFNGAMLINDMTTLTPVIRKLAEDLPH